MRVGEVLTLLALLVARNPVLERKTIVVRVQRNELLMGCFHLRFNTDCFGHSDVSYCLILSLLFRKGDLLLVFSEYLLRAMVFPDYSLLILKLLDPFVDSGKSRVVLKVNKFMSWR